MDMLTHVLYYGTHEEKFLLGFLTTLAIGAVYAAVVLAIQLVNDRRLEGNRFRQFVQRNQESREYRASRRLYRNR